jgi:hypothetical protein
MKEDKSRKWFKDKRFLQEYDFLKRMTVSEFLFKHSRDDRATTILDNSYNNFVEYNLEKATLKEELPIDLLLILIEIDSMRNFMKEKFLKLVKIDNSLLEENALDLLISLLCEPSRFFNLYKAGRKL